MTENLQCICLRVVRHNDSRSIATVWSLQRGRMAISVPASATAAARRVRALVQPLGTFECLARWRQGQEVASISDVRSLGLSVGASASPVKNVLALFIADFLYAVLKESQPDALLSDFLFGQAALLAALPAKKLANFHLSFAYRLTQFLGIAPDMSGYADGAVFDLREARFVKSRPTHNLYIEGDAARVAYLLSRLNERNMHLLKLTAEQRNLMLDTILHYYTLHYAPMSALQSLQVMRQIFGR